MEASWGTGTQFTSRAAFPRWRRTPSLCNTILTNNLQDFYNIRCWFRKRGWAEVLMLVNRGWDVKYCGIRMGWDLAWWDGNGIHCGDMCWSCHSHWLLLWRRWRPKVPKVWIRAWKTRPRFSHACSQLGKVDSTDCIKKRMSYIGFSCIFFTSCIYKKSFPGFQSFLGFSIYPHSSQKIY